MTIHPLLAAVTPYTLTSGRLVAAVAALLALGGVVVGTLAAARSRPAWRRPAIAALGAGVIGMIGGGYVVAVADGGPGTGYGIVGGYAALALGLIATAVSSLALARAHRSTVLDTAGRR